MYFHQHNRWRDKLNGQSASHRQKDSCHAIVQTKEQVLVSNLHSQKGVTNTVLWRARQQVNRKQRQHRSAVYPFRRVGERPSLKQRSNRVLYISLVQLALVTFPSPNRTPGRRQA